VARKHRASRGALGMKYGLDSCRSAGLFCAFLSCALALFAALAPVARAAEDVAARVEAAASWELDALKNRVRNASVVPNWLNGGKQFWYVRDGARGKEVVLVDVSSGSRRTAFDAAAMKISLDATIGKDSGGLYTAPWKIDSGKSLTIRYRYEGRQFDCDARARCRPSTQRFELNDQLLLALNGSVGAFVRDHDLWLRDLRTTKERRLTDDGAPLAAYASVSDQERYRARHTSSEITAPAYTYWSPNGAWLITRRLDERKVAPYPFFEATPRDGSFRPRVSEVRIPLLGDETLGEIEHVIIDVESGRRYPIELPEGFDLNDPYPANLPLAWAGAGNKALMLATSADAKIGKLLEVDLATGKSRVVLEEQVPNSRVFVSPMFGQRPLVEVLDDELIWYSERDNYGHLYLYDLRSGALKRQLTRGDGPVSDILHVDRRRRALLVTKSRGGEFDPYHLAVYRIGIDDGSAVLLTPDALHHTVPREHVSPDGTYFVDTRSTLNDAPVSTLRSIWNPNDVHKLESADLTSLLETGWKPARRMRVKAADGETNLYAALYVPYLEANRSESRPIVIYNYLNSILSVTPVGFMDGIGLIHGESLRRLGYYVVILDGRGTPKRSRTFREFGYPSFADVQIEDHVAAIQELARRDPLIDATRVGIWGSSNGGAGASRAALKRPDFFKVAVAVAGSHDYASLPPGGVKYFGVPRYQDGTSFRPRPADTPENYVDFDNAVLANRLSGKLLIAYGDQDTYALPATSQRLVRALVDANKSFDLLYLPGREHFFLYEPYFKRRLLEYFATHLE
jgi:dipeptidyl-peptidase 4